MTKPDPEEYLPLRRLSTNSTSLFDYDNISSEQATDTVSGYQLINWKFSDIWNCVATYLSSMLLGLRYCRTRRQLPPRLRVVSSMIKCGGFLVAIIIAISTVEALLYPSYMNPPTHYHDLEDQVRASTRPGRGNPNNEKIFIGSNIIREDLIRGQWGSSLLDLIDLLGPNNVFVSIYENDSGSDTAAALRELGQKLPCNSSIVTGAHLPLDSFPTVVLPTGELRIKRIMYLSEVRNRILWPLDNPAEHPSKDGFNYTASEYDRILFLNDVFFHPMDALHLLFSTNLNQQTQRADYRAACAVDFLTLPKFYDTFAVRDAEGYGIGLSVFPWFTSKGRGESRLDVLAGKDAVRVSSCWGGMAAYDAKPFLRSDESAPLRFRHESELFWESSECCLLNADLSARNESSNSGIYLNPYIRVAYDFEMWSWIPFVRRFERVFKIIQYCISRVGYPEYNPRRLQVAGQLSLQERWVYEIEALNGEEFRSVPSNNRVSMTEFGGRWEMIEEVALPGGFCGVRRLFVMKRDLQKANRGTGGGLENWEMVAIP